MKEFDPPAMIGRFPLPMIDSIASDEVRTKSFAVKSASGGMIPMRWCGTPLHSS
ncbi:hypothetical protein HanRHA438_Chr01g0003771 [Helianthus annuus]|nr:hypothetical protein HanRHA438_Chr01g0003771 [Helianthus annuus]